MNKLYARRRTRDQLGLYEKHVAAMRRESLKDPDAIAAELAHRDIQIKQLGEYLENITPEWLVSQARQILYLLKDTSVSEKVIENLTDISEARRPRHERIIDGRGLKLKDIEKSTGGHLGFKYNVPGEKMRGAAKEAHSIFNKGETT